MPFLELRTQIPTLFSKQTAFPTLNSFYARVTSYILLNILKINISLKDISRFSSYLTVITLSLSCKNQSLKVV